MFTSFQNKGFHITYENGWTISVQFGSGSYCANQSAAYNAHKGLDRWYSPDAEVAVWDATGKWFKLSEDDDVIGQQSPAEVLALMNRVAAFTPCV